MDRIWGSWMENPPWLYRHGYVSCKGKNHKCWVFFFFFPGKSVAPFFSGQLTRQSRWYDCKLMLARSDPLVVLYIMFDCTQDYLLHNFPQYLCQAERPVDCSVEPSCIMMWQWQFSSCLRPSQLTRTAGKWWKVAWWTLPPAPLIFLFGTHLTP